jgi:hypothetical protein
MKPSLTLLAALLGLAFSVTTGCSDLPAIVITTPSHGEFTTAMTTAVTGKIQNADLAVTVVTVNGAVVALDGMGAFSTTVTLDPASVFNPIVVELLDTGNGFARANRVTVISGDSIADGAFSPESLALRLNDSGLDTLEGIVADLVDFDPADLVPLGTIVLDECVVFDPLFGFCLGSARVTIVNPSPSASSFGISIDSMTNSVAADVLVTDLEISLDIDGSGLVPNCPLDISADTTDIFGDYALDPDAIDPTTVDVNQLPGVQVVFGNFDHQLFGICDVPIIGDIIQLFLPDIETLFGDGFLGFLQDPDGAGPLDAPVADAIQQALLGIEIAGPIGQSLGVTLNTPIFDIPEDPDGLTIGADTSVTATTGTGLGQCDAPPSAPDLVASLHVADPFPAFSPTTPSGSPYELGICISTSAFNQLLRAQIECGLLQLELTEFDFGSGPIPLTTGVLSILVPELALFPPSSPLVMRIIPTLAPVLTGNMGPGGELAELRVGHLLLELRDPTPGVNESLLIVAIDFRAGLELLIDDATDQLAPTITTVSPEDVTVSILSNLVQTNEATLQAALPTLLQVALPALGSSLGSFPVPSFLDLELDPVEISRNGAFMSIFANLRVPLLSNGNMEDTLDAPADGVGWEGDLFAIVAAESGVAAINGVSMLRFDATTLSGAAPGSGAEVSQVVDLGAYAGEIATGRSIFQATAFFNRIDAGPDTDSEFQVVIEALDAGSLVVGSSAQVVAGDADPAAWQGGVTGLLLPAATTSARVTILANENVLDDAVSPEFDGHYADNVRGLVLPPLIVANTGFEDGGDTNVDGMGWETDLFAIVGPENGITPSEGSSMLRFDGTEAGGASSDFRGSVDQTLDMTDYAKLIATGTASIQANAAFNRVDADAGTDTLCLLILEALDAGGGLLQQEFALIVTDGNAGTWETANTSLLIPAGTAQVRIEVAAWENVANDLVDPEFDGHYVDDVNISFSP